jgi:hypothetical protein
MKRLSLVLVIPLLAVLINSVHAQQDDAPQVRSLFRIEQRPVVTEKPVPGTAAFFTIDAQLFDRFAPPVSHTITIPDFPITSAQRATLKLRRFEVLSDPAQVVQGTADGDRAITLDRSFFFSGSVEEIPGSFVYLALFRHYCSGYIEVPTGRGDERRRFAIAPLALRDGSPSMMTIYDEPAALTLTGAAGAADWHCGSEEVPGYSEEVEKVFKEMRRIEKNDAPRPLANNLLVAQLAVDCDAAYSAAHGNNLSRATNYVLTVIGAVSAVYQRDVNVIIQVPYLRVWNGTDPYPGTNTGQLLPQFRTYWNANMNGVRRTLAHLFSTSAIGGGIAYVNTLCAGVNTGFGYAVSGLNNNVSYPTTAYVWDTDVTSHELGHNFGSAHTHACSWSPAIDSCYSSEGGCFPGTNPRTGTIMSYCHLTAFGTLLNFHPRVGALIRSRAENATCISAVEGSAANDVAVASIAVPAPGGALVASTPFTPSAVFKNVGTNNQTALSVIFRMHDATGTLVYADTQTVASLAAGGSTTVSFTSTSLATIDRYSSTVSILLGGDSYLANNSMVRPFQIVASFTESFTILTPNTAATYKSGSTVTITWASTGGIANARLEFTPDDGATWHLIDASVSAGTGSFAWRVPPIPTSRGRVRISNYLNAATSDESDQLFTIITLPLDWQWARSAGSSMDDDVQGLTVDAQGNVYMAGTFSDSLWLGATKLTSNGGSDGFVAKYNAGGTLQWARGFGGSGSDSAFGVAVDNNGDVYVTGGFSNTIAIGVVNLVSSGDQDLLLAKYDADGAPQWGQRGGGSGRDQGRDIAIDNSGNIYLIGSFSGSAIFGASPLNSAGASDILIARYTQAGGVTWVQRGGGAGIDEGNGIAVNSAGEPFITGRYRVSADFGGSTLNGPAGDNIFVARYNTAGTSQWARSAGGSGDDEAFDIAIDGDDDCYITGVISSTVNFGTTVTASVGGRDFFLTKYSGGGTLRWVRRGGGAGDDRTTGLAIDGEDNIYLTGYFSNTIDVANLTLAPTGTGSDAFVIKYSMNGETNWVHRGGGARAEESRTIAISSGGEHGYLIGRYSYNAPVDLPAIFGDTLTGRGANDIVLTRLGTFKVTAPRDGDTMQAGTTTLITWTTSSSTNVRIEVSYDNGDTWSTILNSTPNSGSLVWNVSNQIGRNGIIRITDADNPSIYGTAYSGTFTIAPISPPSGLVAVGGNASVDLTWSAPPNNGITGYAVYRAPISGVGAGTLVQIGTTAALQRTYIDATVTNCKEYSYAVKALIGAFDSPYSNLDTALPEAPKRITVTAPLADERLPIGTTKMIEWNAVGCIDNVKIDYSLDLGATWTTLVTNMTNSGLYGWTIPELPSARVLIRISDLNDSTIFDITDTFSICGAQVQIAAMGATSICPGDSVILTAPEGFEVYLWSNNATTRSITVKQAGSYSVTVADAMGCGATSQTIAVTVNPSLTPTITKAGDLEFCEGDSVALDIGAGYQSYVWSTGELGQKITVRMSGIYYAHVTSSSGCSGRTDTIRVTVHSTPGKPTLTRKIEGDSLVYAGINGVYQWYRNGSIIAGLTGRSMKIEALGTYLVRVTDSNGCTAISDTFEVDTLPTPPASIAVETGERSFKIHPNPTSGIIAVEAELAETGMVRITITDLAGREAMRIEEPRATGRYRRTIDIGKLPTGAYVLEMQAGTRKWTRKIVKQ